MTTDPGKRIPPGGGERLRALQSLDFVIASDVEHLLEEQMAQGDRPSEAVEAVTAWWTARCTEAVRRGVEAWQTPR